MNLAVEIVVEKQVLLMYSHQLLVPLTDFHLFEVRTLAFFVIIT